MYELHLFYKISVSILLLSGLVSGLELLSVPKRYLDFVYPVMDTGNKYTKWLSLNAIQAALSLVTFCLLIANDGPYYKISFVLLAFVNLYSYRLRSIGKDGSDQVRLLGLLSYSLCFLVPGETGERIAIYFMAMQVILGYTTSGIMKVSSPYWRKGDVLAGILGTYSYGIPGVSNFLKQRPLVEKNASHMAIAAMFSVAIAFCLPYQLPLMITLAIMFSFHFSISVLMGLNDFIITFPMAYPGIILLHAQVFGLPVF